LTGGQDRRQTRNDLRRLLLRVFDPQEEPAMASARKWSAEVTAHSNAMDLKKDVFKQDDPKAIARSLKQSAERSHRRKGSPFQSAMSMLTFYINRAGENLSAAERRKLEAAKDALRREFGREPS
jgi:hypothetical protein